MEEAVEAAVLFRPHVVVTVDLKGFSFRFLKKLRGRCSWEDDGPVHVQYVAPSFWAWKGGESRLKGLTEIVDYVLCILPFEEEVCRRNGLAATYVGHPLLEDALRLNPDFNLLSDKWKFQGDGDAFLSKHGVSPGATLITLLPGSRLQEVTRMLPIFLQMMELVKDQFAELTVTVPVAPNHHVETYIKKEIQSWSLSTVLLSGESLDEKYDAFSASKAAVCTSGSAVMELQLAGLPSVVAYRAHLLTEWIIQLKTKLQFISLPNILLDSAVIPESLFHKCSSNNLAALLNKIIVDNNARQQQIAAAEKVFNLLRSPLREFLSTDYCSPSMIAASTILQASTKQ